jgi:hypothetical protein
MIEPFEAFETFRTRVFTIFTVCQSMFGQCTLIGEFLQEIEFNRIHVSIL